MSSWLEFRNRLDFGRRSSRKTVIAGYRSPQRTWRYLPFRTSKCEKAAANRGFSMLDSLKETGAGEAIRTLDPNLGKVVLYP
jgi:hypothetical protein